MSELTFSQAIDAQDDLDKLDGKGLWRGDSSNPCRGDPYYARSLLEKYGFKRLSDLRAKVDVVIAENRKPRFTPKQKNPDQSLLERIGDALALDTPDPDIREILREIRNLREIAKAARDGHYVVLGYFECPNCEYVRWPCDEPLCRNEATVEGWDCRGATMMVKRKMCDAHKHLLGPKEKKGTGEEHVQ